MLRPFMHPFVLLAAALALVVGQAEPDIGSAAGTAAPATGEPEPAAEPAGQPPARPPRQQAPAVADPGRPAGPSRPAEPDRTQVARAALAFLDALVAGDAAALAAASTERFSFDGEVRAGKDEVRRAWQAFLAGRDAPKPATLLDLELLTSAEAASRLGPPPPRLAALAAGRGTWVAVANVSRRPVILFVVREGSRFAVSGME